MEKEKILCILFIVLIIIGIVSFVFMDLDTTVGIAWVVVGVVCFVVAFLLLYLSKKYFKK